MTNITSDKEHSHNNTTFRFGCGRIQHIDDKVIQQIPYLAALVSIANHVSNIKDEDGHILLNTNINFHHFNVIIDALPFSAIYKIFVRIPDHDDFELIIMLADFLGLIGSVVPTLDEIDTFFFSAWIFKPSNRKYIPQLFPTTMQDVAALFITGLIRGDYDSTDDAVIDRIYWYTMFIISAHTIFHPILRSHLQRACEQYFHLYKPSLLPRLHELSTTTQRNKDCYTLPFIIFELEDGESNKSVHEKISRTYIADPKESGYRRIFTYHSITLYDKDNEFYGFPTAGENFTEDVLVNVVADMINQRLDLSIRRKYVQQIHKCVAMHHSLGFESWIRRTLLHDVIVDDAVRESIRSLIIEGMPAYIDKVKEKYKLYHEAVQNYSEEDTRGMVRIYSLFRRSLRFRLKMLKEVTEKCEVHLNRLTQEKTMLDEIEQRVCDTLYSSNANRIYRWLKNQDIIRELYEADTRNRQTKYQERRIWLNLKRDNNKKHRFHWSNRSQRPLKQC